VIRTRHRGAGATLENRFANLYDFSLDIQRHEIDLEFAHYRGRIHYVFDENIFELFVRPFARSRYVTRSASNVEGETDTEDAGDSAARQTALFCAEALFSGRLPGQVDGKVYLSEWHRWELLSRLNELMIDSGGAVGTEGDLADYFSEKGSILTSDALPADPSSPHDPYVAEDIRHLRDIGSVDSAALLPFWRNRVLAGMISANKTVEPLHQLKRLLSLEMQQRLHGVVSLRRPIGEELERVTASSRKWTAALRREVEARAIHLDSIVRRPKGSFENDGKTLALLEWVASRLGPRERIVLVTGDAALYDTYRRAFEQDLRSRRAGDRPFLLRRPSQYTPLFTATTSSAELDPHLKLFYSVQQAVELPIAALRVAWITVPNRRLEALSRRNSLTLRPLKDGRLQGKAYIHEIWSRFGGLYDQERVAGLEDKLDLNERILNGFSTELLTRRISPQERRILLDSIGEQPEQQRQAFMRYVEEVIEVLVASAVSMWTPIAQKFLKTALVTSLSAQRRYVPVAVNITGDKVSSALELVKFVISSEGANSDEIAAAAEQYLKLSSAFDVFISSSAVALVANDWRMAEHLSEVAINSFKYLSMLENVPPVAGHEAYYLCAVAKRFRLGLIPLDDTGSGYKAAGRIFDQIVNLKSRSAGFDVGSSQSLIDLRSEVEFAGTCLFFSILCLGQSARLSGIALEQEIKETCMSTHRSAGKALERALAIYSSGDVTIPLPDLHGQVLEIVRAQFLINIAAWVALEPLVRRGNVGSFDHRNDLRAACTKDLPALEASLGGARTELFVAEVLAFKISERIEVEESRKKLRNLINSAPVFELELDQMWFGNIGDYWAAE